MKSHERRDDDDDDDDEEEEEEEEEEESFFLSSLLICAVFCVFTPLFPFAFAFSTLRFSVRFCPFFLISLCQK